MIHPEPSTSSRETEKSLVIPIIEEFPLDICYRAVATTAWTICRPPALLPPICCSLPQLTQSTNTTPSHTSPTLPPCLSLPTGYEPSLLSLILSFCSSALVERALRSPLSWLLVAFSIPPPLFGPGPGPGLDVGSGTCDMKREERYGPVCCVQAARMSRKSRAANMHREG